MDVRFRLRKLEVVQKLFGDETSTKVDDGVTFFRWDFRWWFSWAAREDVRKNWPPKFVGRFVVAAISDDDDAVFCIDWRERVEWYF